MRPADLLQRYVDAHNAVVREGSSPTLAGIFEENAEMRFEGMVVGGSVDGPRLRRPACGGSVGPFTGRAAIVAAILARPPSDELSIGRILADDVRAIAPYVWKNSATPGGELVVFLGRLGIARLIVRVSGDPR